MIRRLQVVLVLSALWLPVAAAQSLAELAPGSSLVTLGFSKPGPVLDTLGDDLAELDWARAAETLEQLGRFLEQSGAAAEIDRDFEEFIGILLSLRDFDQDEVIDEAFAFCPAAGDILLDDPSLLVGEDALLTVSLSEFSAIPSVTALAQMADDQADAAANLQTALLDCLEEVGAPLETLQEGDTTLYLVGDGSDLPVIVASIGNVYIIGTNPETVRGVVRRANGEDSPNFAGTGLYQNASMVLDQDGVSLSINFDGLAQLAGSFRGMVVGNAPDAASYAYDRGTAVLRTLGGYAGNLGASDEGLLFETILTVNPEGGDPALADLLLCDTCTVSTPSFAAADSVTVFAQYVALEELFDYLQDWVDGAEEFIGPVDTRELLQSEFGFDIDVALFNWLEQEVYTVAYEPISSDLATLIYQPAQVLGIAISGQEAAEAGFAEFEQLLPILISLVSQASGDEFPVDILTQVATDSFEYEGINVDTYRFSANVDLGVAYVGDLLLIGSPFYAIERAIDVLNGNEDGIAANEAYSAISDTWPSTLGFAYSDDQTQLASVTDLLSLFVQPAAFVVSTGLQAALNEIGNDSFSGFSFPVDLGDSTATPLEVPSTVQETLSEDDGSGELAPVDYYELSGLSVGDVVTATLNSDDFDTYLYLIDRGNETVRDENDDFPSGNFSQSQLEFTVEEGVTYWIGASSFAGGTGDYSLEVTNEQIVAADLSVPPFGDILHLFEIVPEALFIISDNLSYSDSYLEVRDNGLYSRSLTRIAW